MIKRAEVLRIKAAAELCAKYCGKHILINDRWLASEIRSASNVIGGADPLALMAMADAWLAANTTLADQQRDGLGVGSAQELAARQTGSFWTVPQ